MRTTSRKGWRAVILLSACAALGGCARTSGGGGGDHDPVGKQIRSVDDGPNAPQAPPAGGCTTDTDCPSDGDPCHAPKCLGNGNCTQGNAANGTTCNDNNLCTTGDQCQGGTCRGQRVNCPGAGDCETRACNPDTGQCESTPLTGTPCDDGDACTTADVCTAGTCTGGITRECVSLNPCEAASCNSTTGACDLTPVQDGTACEDGDLCTVGDTCQSGVCTPGLQPVCTVDVCTTAACDPTTGRCVSSPLPDGTPCNGGDACTGPEACVSGVCTASTTVATSCDTPPDSCHVAGTCDPTTGCSYPEAPDGTPCDDGDPCTTDDVCTNGVCGGSPGGGPGTSVTRTLGFFATHEDATQACLDDGGAVTLGELHIESLESALGLLWANPGRYENGDVRSTYDRAQLILARQVFVAVCNQRLFGSGMSSTLRTDALSALEEADCTAKSDIADEVDTFNNSGDAAPLPSGFDAGPATPQHARLIADDPTGPTSDSCSTGGAP